MNTAKWTLGAAITGLVMGGVAVFLYFAPQAITLSGQFYEESHKTFLKGLTVGTTASGADDLSFPGAGFGVIAGSIGAGERMDYWLNDTGSAVYVDLSLLGYSSGTASTSLRLYAFATSTAPTTTVTTYDYTSFTEALNGANTFLQNSLFATSTTATTTNSQMALKEGKGSGVIKVAANSYLVVFLQNASGIANAPNPLCNGASCEEATSTNRGITSFFWKARYVR